MTTYPGGKCGSGVYQTIINQMPPHDVYVEPFLGGGAIMTMKRPAPLANIATDIDWSCIDNFHYPWPYARLYKRTYDAFGVLDMLLTNGGLVSFDAPSYTPPNRIMVYLDPPYLLSTRSSGPIYSHELTDADHELLLDIITRLDCLVMISGYPSTLYDHMLRDWRRVTYWSQTRGGGMKQEVLWMNYPEPQELHDYRFLGSNFRQREVIKRRKNRWIARLARMKPLERYCMLDAIEQSRSAVPPNPAIAPGKNSLASIAGSDPAHPGDTHQI